jgi:hypothetical protein
MGFDAFFFGRTDIVELETRFVNQSMEFLWRAQYEHLGKDAQIYAFLMYTLYIPPPLMMWDESQDFDDFEDDELLESYNAYFISTFVYTYVKTMQMIYRTNHLLVSLGGDFFYANAFQNFRNNDRIIKYFNKLYGEEF